MDTTIAPKGCGPSINPLFYNLCDLDTRWGVVVEAIAAVGVVTSLVLLVILVASVPFMTNRRKTMVALQASFVVFTLGLFGLTFAFIVGRDFTTCATRRFLFGVMFAGCLACLVMHGLWLTLLEQGNKKPRSWKLYLGALGLWLVEVIINTEWLIITVVRAPPAATTVPDLSCSIANQDFVMALIYVMALLLAVMLMAMPPLRHKDKQQRRDGVFILATGGLTMAIWVVWIVMYVHGNQVAGNHSWDDPTIAIALVCNAWVFLVLYVIPGICFLIEEDPGEEEHQDGDHVYPTGSLVYGNILPEHNPAQQNMYIENNAFSIEEPSAEAKQPVSPYVYNNHLRSAVYQPTELALITKGLAYRDFKNDRALLRATAPPLNEDDGSTLPPSAGPSPSPRPSYGDNGNTLNKNVFW